MPIFISCKSPGFRRCGIAHPAGPVEYSDDHFTPEQLEQLRKEPKLIVQVMGDSKETKIEGNLDPTQLITMEYPMLKKLAKDMGLEFRSNISKKDLVELLSSELVFVEDETTIGREYEEDEESTDDQANNESSIDTDDTLSDASVEQQDPPGADV